MNTLGKTLLCLSIPVLTAGTGCGIYYGIKYHNIDNQVVEDSSGMENLVDELRKSVSNLEEEKTTLTHQLLILQEQYDSLNQLRQKLEDTNNSLEIENAGLQKQFEELNIQNAELETQISDLNKQITTLNSQIDTLNKTLEDNKSSYDEEILNLQIQVTTLQAQVNSLNLTIDDLNNKINSYEEKTIELNTTIANLNNRIEEYEQEIENYKIIIEKLKEINSCVVTFYVDGEVYNVQQVKKTESPISIDNPSNENYIFDGWTVSGSTEIIDPFTYSVVEDIEFVASIRKNKIITFSVDDVVVSTQSIIESDELQLPEEPTKEHYSFLGWSIDGENVVDLNSYIIKGDTNFIAVFEVVTYIVSFVVDGEHYITQTLSYGEEVSVENPFKINYEFVGWSIDGENIIDISTIELNSNITLVAIFRDYDWDGVYYTNYWITISNRVPLYVYVKDGNPYLLIFNEKEFNLVYDEETSYYIPETPDYQTENLNFCFSSIRNGEIIVRDSSGFSTAFKQTD